MRYDVQDKGDCFGNAEKYKDICNRPPDTERLVKALGAEAFAAGAKEAFGAHGYPFFHLLRGFRASIMPSDLD